jgi:hypothetical protein
MEMEVEARSATHKMLPPSLSSKSNEPPVSLAAAKGAALLMRLCRIRKDIDGVALAMAVAYALHPWSDEVINYVTDPVTGLPGRLEYPLEVANVVSACERRHAELAMEETRRRENAAAGVAAAAPPPPPPEIKWLPILEKLRQKFMPAPFRACFDKAQLGTVDGDTLEIILPPTAMDVNEQKVVWCVGLAYPQITVVKLTRSE